VANDYPIVGPASIDLRTFTSILTAAHSPAAGEAPAMYAAIRGYGVDPAVVLAVMQHESSFGKAGIAVGRHNLAGARYYASTAAFGATNRGGWASFPTYAASAAYTAHLLANHAGQGSKGGTARSFASWYAPASDGNKPAAYGAAVVAAINKWRGAPAATTPAKAAAKPAAKAAPKAATKAATPAAAVGGLTLTTGQVYGVATVALVAILVLLVMKG